MDPWSTQLRIFLLLFFGYACYVLCRKAFAFSIPFLQQDFTKQQMGLIVSSQNVAYTISKFACGVLSDRLSGRLMFSVGLIGAGLFTLLFAQCDVGYLAAIWFMNGVMQGCGWPACAKLLRRWFKPEQFGTYWSNLSASANVTGTLVPLVIPHIVLHFGGWQAFMLLSGTMSVGCGAVSWMLLHDCPEDAGLDPIGVVQTKRGRQESSKDESWVSLIYSPFLWILSLLYFIVFCSKTCFENWAQLLLVSEKGISAESAGGFMAAFELGGFVSSFPVGVITDWAIKKKTGKSNPRMIVSFVCMALSAAFSYSLIFSSGNVWLIGFGTGAFLYSNIVIYGVVGTEEAPANLSGTSHAIISMAANLGAVIAGFPMSQLASMYNWSTVFYILSISNVLAALITALSLRSNHSIGRQQYKSSSSESKVTPSASTRSKTD